MEYVIAIFGLGFIITLVVAKGILQAQEYANEQMNERQPSKRGNEFQGDKFSASAQSSEEQPGTPAGK